MFVKVKAREHFKVMIEIPVAHQSAGLVRHMIRAVVETWAVPVDVEATVLLVSEVVTNALVYGSEHWSPKDRITLKVAESSTGLHIEVHDPDQGNRKKVAVQHVEDCSESGRGLALVEALSQGWGRRTTSTGKYVYFDMAYAEPEEPATSADGKSTTVLSSTCPSRNRRRVRTRR